MADFTDTLTDDHIAMIADQPMFFVATAAADARISLSPKGYDSFRVLTPGRVAYLDMAGSGNETHAHLQADGRITVMFCNFANPALILRIYGRGKPVLPADSGWDELGRAFHTAARYAADFRYHCRKRADVMRLGHSADDARCRAASFAQISCAV